MKTIGELLERIKNLDPATPLVARIDSRIDGSVTGVYVGDVVVIQVEEDEDED